MPETELKPPHKIFLRKLETLSQGHFQSFLKFPLPKLNQS